MTASSLEISLPPRRITILGSTGSIGCSTVDLVGRQPEVFAVDTLTAFSNVSLLAKQARELGAKLVVIGDENRFKELKDALSGSSVEVAAGRNALIEAAMRPSDFVMAAIVGAAGLEPTLAAVCRGATVGLANKECLVCAGDLMKAEMEKSGATLLPVDSEHSAIYQVFDFDRREAVESIILTASGGPFRTYTQAQMENVTPEQAVAHPNWDMGAKISVDSATMMNKGLEIIEAYHLFGIESEKIQILVHPQSVIHSCVTYVDGSVLSQMGVPDMRTPIAYSLAWPRRMATPVERLDLASIAKLTFEAPDFKRFPSLSMAYQALKSGGSAPTILNAANEVAVAAFLDGKIGFLDIVRVVEKALERMPSKPMATLAHVHEIDTMTRDMASDWIVDFARTGGASSGIAVSR
ncbi:MAG TPA: 1-deoxy-D-xylulose-5-phosphate reductoisomerase [Alphaproteobacteria bacterium]|jgi:1-deoxy-D-xylulose-5-phosphate reductoisomerase|nr:1-deoxy-D-xylulose-5-phosphate reductoisomerase [Alphaproteobacteria bacterium]HJO88318.1 1-deoxy-D-xylulose-5-phosphate reductoisomerase [Alphaproteobacteria bacterium]|tara:strand:+ start:96 stop:1322 length:1227 start_codon:yes stop_codon:yes gene_type:complete